MPENNPELKLGLTLEAITHLEKVSKWTSFLSILGFIYTGLLVLMGIAAGSIMRSISPAQSNMSGFVTLLMGVVYVVIAVVYFFPMLFLFRFSVYAKQSLQKLNSTDLTLALGYLRKHYSYIGVLAIIALALIPVGIAIAIGIALLR